MANTLTFTSSIAIKNITGATILRSKLDEDVVNADGSVGQAVLDIQLTGQSGTTWGAGGAATVYPLAIRNGSCDAIVPVASPTYTSDAISFERMVGGAGIATLFTDVLTASKARVGDANVAGQVMTNNGRTNMLKVLQAAVGNRVAGGTATVLPAGPVT